MGEPAEKNALRRKAHVGHRAREAEGLSPTRALRLAMARAAGDLWELPLTVNSIRHEIITYEDIRDRFADEDMLMLLDGPDGALSAASADRALRTSVTEVQTIGKVTDREPPARAVTPTDAALFAPLIDMMMERLDLTLSGSSGDVAAHDDTSTAWLMGYRFGAMVENRRTLALALEGQEFHFLIFDIDVAAGLRRGTLSLCMPDIVPAPKPEPEEKNTTPGAHADSLALVSANLTACMPRIKMSVAQITALKDGDTIPLDTQSLFKVELRSGDGRVLAHCRLGQVSGARAVRIQARGAQPDMASARGGDDEFVPVLPNVIEKLQEGGNSAAPLDVPDLPDLPPLDFDEAMAATPEPADAAQPGASLEVASPDDLGNASFE
ncbi:FliM/FliN family flagellar motor C-terminal domain-containing protein [Primorskyibacter sp. S187A]|uniref:flagellar motor switch protein FliM n=1 Tax=Primorskyibacter sp. S187A TaxID=3415130 RepID=UPI003C7B08E0